MYTPQTKELRDISFSRRVTLYQIWAMLDRKYPRNDIKTTSEEHTSTSSEE